MSVDRVLKGLIAVAVVVLLGLTVRQQNEICSGQNEVRTIIRHGIDREIEQAENTPPDVLKAFDLPPDRIKQLVDQQVSDLKAQRAEAAPEGCGL